MGTVLAPLLCAVREKQWACLGLLVALGEAEECWVATRDPRGEAPSNSQSAPSNCQSAAGFPGERAEGRGIPRPRARPGAERVARAGPGGHAGDP